MVLKKTLERKVVIPEGVTIDVSPVTITVKGKKEQVSRKVGTKVIVISVEGNTLKIVPKKKQARREKAIINSLISHIKNMIDGVQKPHTYTLKVCSSHFPMKVTLKGKVLEVQNFMGEKDIRRTTIKEGVDIKVEGDKIVISSPDKELAGIVATDIEKSTKRPAFDRRVFMDGIYLTEKAGVKIQ